MKARSPLVHRLARLRKDITGIDSPFEVPAAPELIVPPEQSVERPASQLLALLS